MERINHKDLVGQPFPEVRKMMLEYKKPYRVAKIGKNYQAGSLNYDPARFNFYLDGIEGTVTQVTFG